MACRDRHQHPPPRLRALSPRGAVPPPAALPARPPTIARRAGRVLPPGRPPLTGAAAAAPRPPRPCGRRRPPRGEPAATPRRGRAKGGPLRGAEEGGAAPRRVVPSPTPAAGGGGRARPAIPPPPAWPVSAPAAAVAGVAAAVVAPAAVEGGSGRACGGAWRRPTPRRHARGGSRAAGRDGAAAWRATRQASRAVTAVPAPLFPQGMHVWLPQGGRGGYRGWWGGTRRGDGRRSPVGHRPAGRGGHGRGDAGRRDRPRR